jgi:hypothetical protein
MLLDRAWGRPKEQEDPPPLAPQLKKMSDAELAEHAVEIFVAGGMSEKTAPAAGAGGSSRQRNEPDVAKTTVKTACTWRCCR